MAQSQLTSEQLKILMHTIGLAFHHTSKRNYYCTSAHDPEMVALVDLGLMMPQGQPMNNGNTQTFKLTKLGYQWLGIIAT